MKACVLPIIGSMCQSPHLLIHLNLICRLLSTLTNKHRLRGGKDQWGGCVDYCLTSDQRCLYILSSLWSFLQISIIEINIDSKYSKDRYSTLADNNFKGLF